MKHPIKPLTAVQQIVAYVDDKICGLSTAQESALTAFISNTLDDKPKKSTAKAALKAAAVVVALLLSAFAAGAAEPRGSARVDTRLLSGVQNNVQDELLRLNYPVFLITSTPNPFIITNKFEGQYFVATNNIISLPNPTNNYPRKFVFIGVGTNTFTLSNGMGGGLTVLGSNLVQTIQACSSNRLTTAWSTGTNWAVLP